MASVKKRIRSRLRPHRHHRQQADDNDDAELISPTAFGRTDHFSGRKEMHNANLTPLSIDDRFSHMTRVEPSSEGQLPVGTDVSLGTVKSNNQGFTKSVSTSSLVALPDDILTYLVRHHLPFNTLMALRRTCHQFHCLIDTSIISRVRERVIQDLLKDEAAGMAKYRETNPCHRFSRYWTGFLFSLDYTLRRLGDHPATELICYGCLETLPIWRFVERMSTNGTGWGGKLARQRRCKDCMRRLRFVGGVWWKENWVAKRDVIRCRTRREKMRGLFERSHTGLRDLTRSEQEGVCHSCGTTEEELWWGCSECYEVEMRARSDDRINYWDMGLFNGRNGEAKNRKRCVAAMENVLSHWEIWTRAQREANRRIKDDVGRRRENRRRTVDESCREVRERSGHQISWETSNGAMISQRQSEGSYQWKPFDEVPLPTDRWESRCATCWVPTVRKHWGDLSVVYDWKWPSPWMCKHCQKDHAEHEARKQRRRPCIDDEEDQLLAGVRQLFL